MENGDKPLAGRLILLIESEGFLASHIEAGITGAGGKVLGPARSLEEAGELVRRLRQPPDAAVVDLIVEGGSTTLVIDVLLAKEIRVVLVGTPRIKVPRRLFHLPLYRSPIAADQIVTGLQSMFDEPPDRHRAAFARPQLRGH